MNELFLKNYFAPFTLILLVPFLLFSTIININNYDFDNNYLLLFPNLKSSIFFFGFLTYGFLSIKISNKRFIGNTNVDGFTPNYAANGFEYWIITTLITILFSYIYPIIPILFYDNFIPFLMTANLFGLFFVYYLYQRDKINYYNKNEDDKIGYNELFRFFRGLKFHPTLIGVDIKQWTNCRFGMASWQVIIILFLFYHMGKYGLNYSILSTVLLQTVYIGKFFYWETGYFNTLDITLDRAGYYICWGCLVFIPSFYTFTVYYLINRNPMINNTYTAIIFFSGLLFTYLNYEVDRQKEVFKSDKENAIINFKKAKYLNVQYIKNDKIVDSKLLLSGFWGISRHMNYTFEILMSACWCLVGFQYGILPFAYLFYIIFLLVHRIYRDEKKCSEKYGEYWNKYCNLVKYRLIKYIY